MDSLDEKLIELLRHDARPSSETLAKHLKVSPATVRRRIKRLIKKEVIRIVAVADPNKTGIPLAAIITFDVAHDKMESALELLASRPEIKWVCSTTGRFDIISLARFSSTEELAKFVQSELTKIDGLRDSETFICLDVKKGRWR